MYSNYAKIVELYSQLFSDRRVDEDTAPQWNKLSRFYIAIITSKPALLSTLLLPNFFLYT